MGVQLKKNKGSGWEGALKTPNETVEKSKYALWDRKPAGLFFKQEAGWQLWMSSSA